MHTFDLNIKDIAKIEGKATLTVRVKDDEIEYCKFAITEFKRFYTAALRGKDVLGLPQLSCRVCGTCSNAHLLCAIKAAENALGVTPSTQTKLLRELLNYGLLIRDHGLHCYVFALPDILKVDNILDLDENDPYQHQLLHDTFDVKSAGNALGVAIGGRSVHAPYPVIGGFTKLPNQQEFPKLIEKLESIRPAVLRLIKVFMDCSFTLIRNTSYVAMIDDTFTFLDGDIHVKNGSTIKEHEYGNYLEKIDVPHSHATAYTFNGDVHMTGALARMNIGAGKLHKNTKDDAADAIALFPSNNIYHNNLAQAIEILHAIDKSVDILKTLTIADEKPPAVIKKSGIGVGVIEAPRGLLFYKLTLDDKGIISAIQIVVPTGQNQLGITQSIYEYIKSNLSTDKDQLVDDIEKIVRAYDPCMSCASHFLKIRWKYL